MSKVINFKEKLKEKQNKKSKKDKKTVQNKFVFEYKFMANYDKNELYINVNYSKYDINVDIDANLKIIKKLIEKNPMTIVTKDLLRKITGLSDQYLIAIFNVYKEFGFINQKTHQVKSLDDIAKSYIAKRIQYGYPKDKEKFKKILTLEKSIFSKYLKDNSMFSEKLYWKTNNNY